MDVVPFKEPGQNPTCHARLAVTGGRCVNLSTGVNAIDAGVNGQPGIPQVEPSPAAAEVYGVAARDRLGGEKVMVFKRGILPIEVGAVAVAHGTWVETDGLGRIVPLGTTAGNKARVGRVLADGGPGTFPPVDFRPGMAK